MKYSYSRDDLKKYKKFYEGQVEELKEKNADVIEKVKKGLSPGEWRQLEYFLTQKGSLILANSLL